MTDYPCPYCDTVAPLTAPCPGCHRDPDPQVLRLAANEAELIRLDRAVVEARRVLDSLHAQWVTHRRERDVLLVELSARTAARRAAAAMQVPPVAVAPLVPVEPVPWGRPGGRADSTPRTVQNLLFALGGLLVAVGAIVFVLFALARYGLPGAEAVLVGATVVGFAAPVVARWRGLRATAETVSLLALLLLVLDGCLALALWDGPVTTRGVCGYLGALALVVAAVAAFYGVTVDLTGPRVAVLVLVQPAVPLLVVAAGVAGTAGWATVLAAVAAGHLLAGYLLRASNALPITRVERRDALGLAATGTGLAWLGVATLVSLSALVSTDWGIAAALVVALVTGVPTALRVPAGRARAACVALATGECAVAALRAGLTWTGQPVLIVGAVLTVALVALARTLPCGRDLRHGVAAAAVGAVVVLGAPTLLVLGAGALVRLSWSQPAWHADLARLAGPVLPMPGQLVAVAAVVVAGLLLLPRAWRAGAAMAGGVALLVAVQNLPDLAWWTPIALAGAGALVLVVGVAWALVRAEPALATVVAGCAAALAADAVVGALARPITTAAVLAGLAATGAAAVLVGRRLPERHRLVFRGVGLAVTLLAVPGAVAAAAAQTGAGATALLRLTLASAVSGLIVLPALRSLRRYGLPALGLAVTVAGLLPVAVPAGEPVTTYALIGLLVLAVAPLAAGLREAPARRALAAGALLVVPAAVGVLPVLLTPLVLPWSWLGRMWSGRPDGVGLATVSWHLTGSDALAMALLLVIAGVVGVVVDGGRWRALPAAAPVALVTVPVTLAAAGAPWPLVPATTALLGAGGVLAAALRWRRAAGAPVAVVGLAALAAGLAGLTATVAGTLAGLGGLLVLAAVTVLAGRAVPDRLAAGLVAAASAQTLAVTAVRAAPALGPAAYPMLLAAALALLAGAALAGRDPRPARALEAAGHAGALVALLTAGSLTRAGVVAAGWGALVGARALWPGLAAPARRALVSVAAALEVLAWWLLLAAHGVSVVEAYTLPLAGVALTAGWLATRTRPRLGSWVAFGPGLAAGLLPSLAPVLTGGAGVGRRALLGLAALAVVLAGAQLRLAAPVLLGGGVLAVLALHEIAVVIHQLPTWLPLTVAGLLVLTLAITYERRRRDLRRLRAALSRLH